MSMQYFFQDNHSTDLIVFFSGWGCDENQFTNLKDQKDVLILFDYQNLELNFNFNKYDNIYVIAYSAGVFVASIMHDKLPNVRYRVALCGNPYLFNENKGLSSATVEVFQAITLDNYLEFRRQYMVQTEEEYQKYNQLQSLRTLESCQNELECLQKLYQDNKTKINPNFDRAFAAENDVLFNLKQQKDFYRDKLQVIPNAKHHIFFKFKSFADFLRK
jgi:biotin synthesis protein BioG